VRLKEEQKAWLVVQHAMYRTTSQICRDFEEEFGAVIDKRQVAQYHPHGAHMMRKRIVKWNQLFDETRAKYLDSFNSVPIAQSIHRLARLNEMHDRAFEQGNFKLAAELLEMAAKESGGSYTNKHQFSGKIETEAKAEPASPEEIKNTLSDEIAAALGRIAPAQSPTAH